MALSSYIRTLANRTCSNLTQQFTPTFGTPVEQFFGDVATEGASADYARADHRHGMPSQDTIIADLEDTAVYFNELVLTNLSFDLKFVSAANTVLGGLDDVGDLGGFGTVSSSTTAVVGNSNGVYVQNSTAGTTLTQQHPFKRTRNFAARVRPCLNDVTQLPSLQFACGHIRTSVNGDVTTITDGVYFYLATDGGGAGNYQLIATNNSGSTVIDTGVAPRVSSNSVLFDIFRLSFDGTTVVGYINDAQVGSIADANVPSSSRKLAGFGAWITNGTGVVRTMVSDFFLWTGPRSYTE